MNPEWLSQKIKIVGRGRVSQHEWTTSFDAEVWNGLAVHENVNPQLGYCVSHVRSGLLIRGGFMTTFAARAYAEKISPLADWTLTIKGLKLFCDFDRLAIEVRALASS